MKKITVKDLKNMTVKEAKNLKVKDLVKTTYETEETKDYDKTNRIDEFEDGHQTKSTILQSKDKIIINP